MSTKHSISRADQCFVGGGYAAGVFNRNGRVGVPVDFITKVDLGAPKLAVAAGIVNGATGATEAPNSSTIIFTADTQGASPLDPAAALSSDTVNGVAVMVLDVPRNVTAAINTAVGNITVVVTGFDEYQIPMSETLSIAASGTSAVGVKVFKYIRSIALTSSGNDSSKAINVGFGSSLGFPYKIASKSDVLSVWFDDAVDSATITKAVTTDPQTATTGDPRGSMVIAGTLNGTKTLAAYIRVADPGSAVGIRGVAHYAG